MMLPDTEFSHIVKLDEIGAGTSQHTLSANEAERAALALRFDLIALDFLDAVITLMRSGAKIRATGIMRAEIMQACIAGGDDVPDTLEEPLDIIFTPAQEHDGDGEIELAEEDCDTIFYYNKAIDIGEAVAQSLGLALNPYPRSAGATATLKAAGVNAEDEVESFGALSGLRDMLTKK
jgi:uncharacterized metal-binding protein YceD (DUF177 family)